MKNLNQPFALILLLGAMASPALAQRPRSVGNDTKTSTATTTTANTTTTTTTAPAPSTVKAKYEGGVFGHNKKQEGTLTLDDANNRLVFRDKKNVEVLSIPYESVTSAFADTQSRQPKAATVVSAVPLIYALPAHFIKTKVQYLTLQFSDQDTHVAGVTSFRLDNRETVASVLNALAQKAGLTQRGEVFVRRKSQDPADKN